MNTARETIRTIDLDHDQLIVFDGGRDGRVRVLHGGTWLTEEGEAGDSFLHAGAEATLHGGRALIMAIGATRVQLVAQAAGVAALPARWLHRLRRALRRQVARWQLGMPAAEPRG